MRRKENIRELSMLDLLKILGLSATLAAVLVASTIPPKNTVEQPESPVTTPQNGGPRLSQ